MNYLAHLFLSAESPESLLGAMLGDFVKGPLDERFGAEVRRAIALHRAIDSFTDAHPVTRVSRNRVSGRRRRFAGIMIDVFYDHFLALRWAEYSATPLPHFAAQVYSLLMRERDALPERLQRVLPYMVEQDWLSSYRDVAAVASALDRMSRRLKRENALAGGGEELAWHYEAFQRDFTAFFPELIDYARRERR